MTERGIELFHFTDAAGGACFVFLLCDAVGAQAIKQHRQRRQEVDFCAHGEVVAHGEGVPSEAVLEEMRDRFGYVGFRD